MRVRAEREDVQNLAGEGVDREEALHQQRGQRAQLDHAQPGQRERQEQQGGHDRLAREDRRDPGHAASAASGWLSARSPLTPTHRPFAAQSARPCIFEYVYFSRPDSIVDGTSVYSVRKAIGAELARENPVDADLIIPVPDSGTPAPIGYAQESGIPFLSLIHL